MKQRKHTRVWLCLSGILLCLMFMVTQQVFAATPSYHAYSGGVTRGTIRYVSQSTSTASANGWGAYASKANGECGYASQSMALSYVGKDISPEYLCHGEYALGKWHTGYGNGISGTYEIDGIRVVSGSGNPSGSAAVNTINSMLTNFINDNGRGQYSPVVIHYGSSSVMHAIIVIGKESGNYLTLDPARGMNIVSMTLSSAGEVGGNVTYATKGCKINGVQQYYNAGDNQPLSISNVKVSNVTSDSYTVSCNITGNVTKALFPTWPSADDSGNPIWHEGTISGNVASCVIKRSDHGNKIGIYISHIYIYDAAGNSVASAAPEVQLVVFNSCLDYPAANASYTDKVYVAGWVVIPNGITNVTGWCNGISFDLPLFDRSDVPNGKGFNAFIPETYMKNGINSLDIYGYHGTTPYHIKNINFTYKDIKKPTISDVKIINITEDSYTVTCKVSDNVKVASVFFPTWPSIGNSTDPIWHQGSINGDTASCVIKKSDHENKTGTYISHIYVYDEAGNEAAYAAPAVELGKKHQHDYTSSIKKPATCTESGIKLYVCKDNDDSYEEEIPATGHQHTEIRNVKSATCAEEGYTGDICCKDCDTKLSSGKAIAKKNHIWDSGVIIREATCTVKGIKTYTCTVCKTKKTENIPDTGHRNVEYRNSKTATCAKAGYTGDLYCKECNMMLRRGEAIAKKPHTWDTGSITTETTCIQKGIKTYTCTVCNTTKTEEIPATGHQYTELRNAKPATTDTEGYTGDTYCTDCNQLISKGTSIPKIPVDENAPTITISNSKAMAGKEVAVNVDISKNTGIAGYSYDINYDQTAMTLKSVSAGKLLAGNGQISINKNVVNWYTADNVTGDGTLMQLTFTVNKDTEAGNYPVSVALHDGKKNLVDEKGTFINANYIAGQIEVTKGMTGDLNGDEDITIADVVLLNRHVLGKETLTNEQQMLADLNGDGDITIADVVILNRVVLGKESLLSEAAALSAGTMETETLEAAAQAKTEEMQISVENATVEPGSTVDIPVYLRGNTGLAGFALTVNMPEGYRLNSIKPGTILSGGSFSAYGNNCTWYTGDNISTNGLLLTLNVTVSGNAKSGQIAVTVKDGKASNLSDERGNAVTAKFTAGTVSVDSRSECDKNGHKGGTATCISKAVCEVCGQEYGEKDLNNHIGKTEIRNKKAATCTEKGYSGDEYCTGCNAELSKGTEIAALGHNYGDWTVVKPATAMETGLEERVCIRDNTHKETREIPKEKISLEACSIQLSETAYVYDGTEKKPGVTVVYDGTVLTEGTDYVLIYKNNTAPGTASVTAMAMDDSSYRGEITADFEIRQALEEAPVVIEPNAFSSCANLVNVNIRETVTKIGDQAFADCKNLRNVYFYGNCPEIGNEIFRNVKAIVYYPYNDVTWTLEKLQNYGGTITWCPWDPETGLPAKRDLSRCEVSVNMTVITYDGTAQTPEVTVADGNTVLQNGKDYTLSYANNVNAGKALVTVTGTGSYEGNCQTEFVISQAEATLKFQNTSISKKYGNQAFVNEWKDKKTDGKLTWSSSNTRVATVSASGQIKITGVGNTTITVNAAAGTNYKAGKAAFTVKVAKGKNVISTSDINRNFSTKAQTVSIGARVYDKAKISYTSDNRLIKVSSIGKITIPARFSGKCVITIKTAATTRYESAVRKIRLTVKPSAAAITKTSNLAGGRAYITWNINRYATGYLVQYSTDSSFRSSVGKVYIGRYGTTKTTLSGLKKGKTYYIRIAAYKQSGTTKVYSRWSKVRNVKVTR